MSPPAELPGLEHLMEACRRHELRLKTTPPGHGLPSAGTLIAGVPFDPVLAAVYTRLGQGTFATDVAGIILRRFDDEERKLEADNQWWSQGYRQQLALPTFIFATEPLTAYHYATVPGLADEEGRQPVVFVDVHEEPYALPVASSVDRFFDSYARYLEAVMALPNAREEEDTRLIFPWDASDIIGRDSKLLEGIRAGRFDPFMPGIEEQAWARKVLAAGVARI
jgi:hypothetical protein